MTASLLHVAIDDGPEPYAGPGHQPLTRWRARCGAEVYDHSRGQQLCNVLAATIQLATCTHCLQLVLLDRQLADQDRLSRQLGADPGAAAPR